MLYQSPRPTQRPLSAVRVDGATPFLWLWLTNETTSFQALVRLLHFAPEWRLKPRIAACGTIDYRTADLTSPLAHEHLDILDIPYEDESVDVVFCNHVLEHIPDDRAAMTEVFRILRPGGWALVMTPLSKDLSGTREGIEGPGRRLLEYGQEDHVRLYGQDFYRRLEEAGFQVEEIDYANALADDDIARYRLRRRHHIFADDNIILARKR